MEQDNSIFPGSVQPYIQENRVRVFNDCKKMFENMLQDSLARLSSDVKMEVERYENYRVKLSKRQSKHDLDNHMVGFLEQHQDDSSVTIGNFCFEVLIHFAQISEAIDENLEPLCDDTMADWVHTAKQCENIMEDEDDNWTLD